MASPTCCLGTLRGCSRGQKAAATLLLSLPWNLQDTTLLYSLGHAREELIQAAGNCCRKDEVAMFPPPGSPYILLSGAVITVYRVY